MKVLTLKDLEARAGDKVDKGVFDFWQSGANDLVTLRENSEAFNRYRIVSRTMVDVSKMSIKPAKKLFGRSYDAPIGIAPSAHHILAAPCGEEGTARACQNVNVPMALSSFSNFSVNEVNAAAPTSAVFMQLYVFRNRKVSEMLVRRAEKAGFKAILLTTDTPYIGTRYADQRNDFLLPTGIRLGNFENLEGAEIKVHIPNPVERKSPTNKEEEGNLIDPSLTWSETIAWLKSFTKLEIWAKGIVAPEDAELAIQAGIDGIWVSNHGGRQLDNAIPTIEALPAVVEAVKGRVPVHVDSGVRNGGDVFKALALGADYVWVGRPALWGLSYDGQKGVELMLGMLKSELQTVMALAGTRNVADITKRSLMRYGPRLEKL